MKNLILILSLLIGFVSFGQTEKVYTSLKEALKNPEQVLHLDLSDQSLTKISKKIQKFTNLKTLDLSGNQIQKLPDFNNLRKLEKLNLSGNPLTYEPVFLKMAGDEKNVVAENVNYFQIKYYNRSRLSIENKGFEGTIGSPSSIQSILGKNEQGKSILKLYPIESRDDIWLEIHPKSLDNSSILSNLFTNSSFTFGYFVNKHLTYDQNKNVKYVLYKGANVGAVNISSSSFIVFYDFYTIIPQTNKKSLSMRDCVRLLSYALTYEPLNTDQSITAGDRKFQETDPEALTLSELPASTKLEKNLPELPINKEIVYTLRSGESVVFGNEYQLGIDLKGHEYYIYLQKGDKFYIKTAKRTLGPYDELYSAGPYESYGKDLVHEFRAIKGDKAYFISEGVQYGPFPLDSREAYVKTENKLIVYEWDDNWQNFSVTMDGVKYGPFHSRGYERFINGQMVFVDLDDETGLATVYLNKKKVMTCAGLSTFSDVVSQGVFYFGFEKEGQKYVRVGDKTLGPYERHGKLFMFEENPTFEFTRNEKNYLQYGGQEFGPYEHYSIKIYNTDKLTYTAQQGGNLIIYVKGEKIDEFAGNKPNLIHENQEAKAWMLTYWKDDGQYVYHNGNHYGPYKKVITPDYRTLRYLQPEDKYPVFIGYTDDFTHDCYFKSEKIGPLKIESTLLIDESDAAKMIVENVMEGSSKGFYLLTEDKMYGPYEDYKSYSSNNKLKPFEPYPVAMKTKTGEYHVVTGEKNYGPFEDVSVISTYYNDAEIEFVFKKDGQYFYMIDNLVYGPLDPIDKESFLTRKYQWRKTDPLTIEEGITFEKYSAEGTWETYYSYVNGNKTAGDYRLLDKNGNNFIAVDEYSEQKKFIINNQEYSDSTILNYSYWEGQKTFYWLSLDGNKIIRNSVKL